MKLAELTIKPEMTWKDVGPENPLRAVVKLRSKDSTVECVLSEDAMRRMVDLCAAEIAENAKRHVDDFVAAVGQIEGSASALMLDNRNG